MRLIEASNARVLITTPDYPPQLGGLSTFTKNIEKALRANNIPYDLLIWNSVNELRAKTDLKNYNQIFHINFMAGFFLQGNGARHVNFIHGSEILFYSPSLIKRILKKIMKNKMIKYFEKSYLNIFISEFTQKILEQKGLNISYDRDHIIHNSIDCTLNEKSISNLDEDTIRLVAVARDVPHKNLDGCVQLAKELTLITGKKVELAITAESRWCTNLVEIKSLANISDEKRDEFMKRAHFNLLLSHDHRKKGFYEGFGLTVLEAGKWGTPSIVATTGGLSESVHHGQTGWHLNTSNMREELQQWWHSLGNENYQRVAEDCFEHTIRSHGLEQYEYLLKVLVK